MQCMEMERIARFAASIVALTLVTVPVASAVDGVFEINQAKILANGGFPFNIVNSGSYRLTSNIDVGVAADPKNTTVITIAASDVTIDLNGFTIKGINSCTTPSSFGGSIQCTNRGNGIGIQVIALVSNIVVKNGIVRGMGNNGIDINAAFDTVVENVTANENGADGVRGGNGRVNHVVAGRNFNHGVVFNGGAVSDVYAALNGAYGIRGDDGTVVASNASANGGYGLQVGNTVGYSNVTATFNNGGAGNVQILGGVSGTGNVCNHSLVNTTCP